MLTGLAYSGAFLRHDTGQHHPERADRLTAIVQRLHSTGLWDRLEVWEPAPAEDVTLELIHTPGHVAYIRDFISRGRGHIDGDTVVSAGSWEAAVGAVGGVVEAGGQAA